MKRLITVFLLVFVASALVSLAVLSFRKREAAVLSDGTYVLFFHSEMRCPTCIHMERLIRKQLDSSFRADLDSGRIKFLPLPYDLPEGRELAERFHVGTISLILLEQKNGKTVRSLDLSEQIWKNKGDAKAMNKILSDEFNAFLSP